MINYRIFLKYFLKTTGSVLSAKLVRDHVIVAPLASDFAAALEPKNALNRFVSPKQLKLIYITFKFLPFGIVSCSIFRLVSLERGKTWFIKGLNSVRLIIIGVHCT